MDAEEIKDRCVMIAIIIVTIIGIWGMVHIYKKEQLCKSKGGVYNLDTHVCFSKQHIITL